MGTPEQVKECISPLLEWLKEEFHEGFKILEVRGQLVYFLSPMAATI